MAFECALALTSRRTSTSLGREVSRRFDVTEGSGTFVVRTRREVERVGAVCLIPEGQRPQALCWLADVASQGLECSIRGSGSNREKNNAKPSAA